MSETTRTKSSKKQGRIFLGVDVPLVLVLITLLLFGLLMVYSASWDFSWWVYDSPTRIFTRQVQWMVLGTGAMALTAVLDYHYWRRWALPAMAITLAGLLVVLVRNEIVLGAARTLSAGSYMPSELAKVVTIIYLSIWLYSKRNTIRDVYLGLVPLALMIGLLSGLILMQPDLSAAATLVFLGGILFFLAGGDLKQIAVLLVIVGLVGWIVVTVHPTGSERVGQYWEGIKDPTQASYHVRRSIEAFIKGGNFGVGIGRADTKYTGLPVPPTDSIFAVVGEETGLAGAGLLVMLYGLLIWRGMVIARRAGDMLGSLLAAGMTLWIGMEALINMAVMVGLVPFAGNALPFISAGGSNLLASMVGVGVLFNVDRMAKLQPKDEERSKHATHGMRGRDRRRGVSRPGRAAGARR